jgi:predicted HTH transcriptional regulator
VRLYDTINAQGAPDRVALFLVPPGDGAICETVQIPARAWIRQGPQNVPLSDAARDRLKRDRRVVDFERAACTRFDAREIDAGVLKEFKDSYLSAASYDWADEELLYQVGAISREGEPEAWTNAGTLFFSANPQRVLPQTHIRLLRFEAPIADRAAVANLRQELRRICHQTDSRLSHLHGRVRLLQDIPAAQSQWRVHRRTRISSDHARRSRRQRGRAP